MVTGAELPSFNAIDHFYRFNHTVDQLVVRAYPSRYVMVAPTAFHRLAVILCMMRYCSIREVCYYDNLVGVGFFATSRANAPLLLYVMQVP